MKIIFKQMKYQMRVNTCMTITLSSKRHLLISVTANSNFRLKNTNKHFIYSRITFRIPPIFRRYYKKNVRMKKKKSVMNVNNPLQETISRLDSGNESTIGVAQHVWNICKSHHIVKMIPQFVRVFLVMTADTHTNTNRFYTRFWHIIKK